MQLFYYNYNDFIAAIQALETLELAYTVKRDVSKDEEAPLLAAYNRWAVTLEIPTPEAV